MESMHQLTSEGEEAMTQRFLDILQAQRSLKHKIHLYRESFTGD